MINKAIQLKKHKAVCDHAEDEEDQMEEAYKKPSCMNKIQTMLKNLMIEPKNRKLRNFHLLLAICFYIDFFLTGFLIGNYPFLHD